MGENKEVKGAQNGAPVASPQSGELVDHVVTDLDLQNNPDLVEKGIKAGETVKIPVEAKAKADAREAAAKTTDSTKGKESDKGGGKPKVYLVISAFADKENFSKKWEEGDDVSHFSADRLADCIKRGLVKKG